MQGERTVRYDVDIVVNETLSSGIYRFKYRHWSSEMQPCDYRDDLRDSDWTVSVTDRVEHDVIDDLGTIDYKNNRYVYKLYLIVTPMGENQPNIARRFLKFSIDQGSRIRFVPDYRAGSGIACDITRAAVYESDTLSESLMLIAGDDFIGNDIQPEVLLQPGEYITELTMAKSATCSSIAIDFALSCDAAKKNEILRLGGGIPKVQRWPEKCPIDVFCGESCSQGAR